ncbi:hypothetical protein CPLU01_00237 [Colletotrichum plurivorum]|uniref:Uncharacterized protein n=1 Tax=Colletotrichum plurivorum TaxID=2175906 RepID=A0A8H6U668_9PEZI|nr:hypothetical protein CPLU01_00237 [Colletotrichum plurivorum]
MAGGMADVLPAASDQTAPSRGRNLVYTKVQQRPAQTAKRGIPRPGQPSTSSVIWQCALHHTTTLQQQ